MSWDWIQYIAWIVVLGLAIGVILRGWIKKDKSKIYWLSTILQMASVMTFTLFSCVAFKIKGSIWLWTDLWPTILLILAACIFISFFAFVFSVLRKQKMIFLLEIALVFMSSTFSFYITAQAFPTA